MRNQRTRIDTLGEKEKLAEFLKARLELLKRKEAQSGELSAETRETVTALTMVLDKIRLESGGIIESPEELKERAFGDWCEETRKKHGKKGDGEE